MGKGAGAEGKDAAKDDAAKKKGKDGKKEPEPEELSEEDQELKANLELCVERIKDPDAGVAKLALQTIKTEIRTSTSSMTSVPKPLKFLRPHFDDLKLTYETYPEGENKALLADIISLLAMTKKSRKDDVPESLKYRMLGVGEDIGTWGHEYVRNLASEIGIEFTRRREADADSNIDDLMDLVKAIVPFHMQHNAEPEAVDLLLEVERLDLLAQHVTKDTYARTCLYLVSCSSYLAAPDDFEVLKVAYDIYVAVGKLPEALRVALKMRSDEHIHSVFAGCEDLQTKRQLAYALARHGNPVDLEDGPCATTEDTEALQEIMSNSKLSELYLALARDLDVMEAKTPEDIYKSHLVEGRQPSGPAVDSARQNLAATFVNAFINAGFGQDKLMTGAEGEGEGNVNWIFKNKDHGRASAAASLGTILLWDVEGGLPQIDKYLYSTEHTVVAGALLAVGLVNTNVRNECDPAYALLFDSVSKDNTTVRIGAIMGLGMAYAGTRKEDVQELLTPVVADDSVPMEVAAFAAVSLGLVFVGTCHQECAQSIVQALMMRPESDLEGPFGKMACLGLGLLFLGKQSAVEATLEVAKTLSPRVSQYLQVMLDACAYAGSGNVLKVQQMLAMCGEQIEKGEGEGWKDEHQAPAVLAIALIAMAEDLGSDMAIRAIEHLLQYGETQVRKACPLALALLATSNPKLIVTDTLSRLSHDTTEEVAQAATLAIGLSAAGTNNARVAGMLRQLSSYYYKEPSLLFLVRVAQGLTHLGKGLLTLNPIHADRGLLSDVALAGLLVTSFCGLEMKSTILGKHHYCLYYLCAAMQPRMLFTVDEEGKPLPVSVRVGEAVDIVGQAGRPKSITGFQTHTTPVLLATGDRAELATDKYIPCSPLLEGVVVLKPNPDYDETLDQ